MEKIGRGPNSRYKKLTSAAIFRRPRTVYGDNQIGAVVPAANTIAGAANVYGNNTSCYLSASALSSTVTAPNIYASNISAYASTRSDGTSTASVTTAAYGLKSTVYANQPNATIASAYGVYSRVYASNSATITNAYGIYVGDTGTTGTITNKYALVTHPTAGNVGIGTTSPGTGGSNALVLGNGSKPTALTDAAGLYAADVSGTTELFSFDEAGNETQQSPHAGDAPNSLYDPEDGIPMIIKEVQHFLGYVRYTNQTRQAWLAGMTDAEKSALPAKKRTCVYMESFADHNTRLRLTGAKALNKLDWEAEQQAIKARRDSEIVAARKAKAELQTSIATEKDEDRKADLIQQEANTKIPAEHTIKVPPARLRAALDASRW